MGCLSTDCNIERRETGTLAAQEDDRLSLLPSGPDEVHGSPLRETHLPPLNLTIDEFWIKKWRRERDSNPRYSFPYTRFPGVLLQPLGHLSIVLSKRSYVVLAHRCNTIILLDSAVFVKRFFRYDAIFFSLMVMRAIEQVYLKIALKNPTVPKSMIVNQTTIPIRLSVSLAIRLCSMRSSSRCC